MERFPDELIELAPDFMSDRLPCDLKAVPSNPRAFPTIQVSQDRHPRRGKNLTDTTKTLKKFCEGRRRPRGFREQRVQSRACGS